MRGFKARATQRRQTVMLVEYFPRPLTEAMGSN